MTAFDTAGTRVPPAVPAPRGGRDGIRVTAPPEVRPRPAGALLRLARRHRAFCVVLALATLLRLLALLAYRPALEFFGDSYGYLTSARTLVPDGARPFGYPALLRLLSASHTIALVPVVQHLLGLGLGVTLYGWLRGRGLPAWLGVVGAAPVLLDAYQVDIEQFVMAETLVDVLLVAALLLLLRRGPGSVRTYAVIGVLLALTVLTRSAASGAVVAVLVFVLLKRVGRRRVAALGAGIAIPLLAYAGWFAATNGSFGLQDSSGAFLYGRVAPFANCDDFQVTRAQSILCSPHPAAERPGPNYYLWDPRSPRFFLRAKPSERDAILADFARKAVLAQPVTYARVVGGDVLHYLEPGRWTGRQDWPDGSWRFPDGHEQEAWHVSRPLVGFAGEPVHGSRNGVVAAILRGYQRQGFTQGPLLALAMVLAVVAAIGWRGRGERRARGDALLLAAIGLSLLVVPAATSCFDYRYLLPTLVVLPPAAALAIHQIRLAAAGRVVVPRQGGADVRRLPTPPRPRVSVD